MIPMCHMQTKFLILSKISISLKPELKYMHINFGTKWVNLPPTKASPAPLVSITFSGGRDSAGNSFVSPSIHKKQNLK